MRIVEGETFTGAVEVDGQHFTGCRFIGCQFVFRGVEPWSFDTCEFEGPPDVRFEGNARMIAYILAAMLASASLGAATERMLEQLLDDRPLPN